MFLKISPFKQHPDCCQSVNVRRFYDGIPITPQLWTKIIYCGENDAWCTPHTLLPEHLFDFRKAGREVALTIAQDSLQVMLRASSPTQCRKVISLVAGNHELQKERYHKGERLNYFGPWETAPEVGWVRVKSFARMATAPSLLWRFFKISSDCASFSEDVAVFPYDN